jgi:hypothetical protein
MKKRVLFSSQFGRLSRKERYKLYKYTHIYVYICIHICIYIYVYIYIHSMYFRVIKYDVWYINYK